MGVRVTMDSGVPPRITLTDFRSTFELRCSRGWLLSSLPVVIYLGFVWVLVAVRLSVPLRVFAVGWVLVICGLATWLFEVRARWKWSINERGILGFGLGTARVPWQAIQEIRLHQSRGRYGELHRALLIETVTSASFITGWEVEEAQPAAWLWLEDRLGAGRRATGGGAPVLSSILKLSAMFASFVCLLPLHVTAQRALEQGGVEFSHPGASILCSLLMCQGARGRPVGFCTLSC